MRGQESWWRRYRRVWQDSPAEADDELAFHFEAHVADLIASGLGRADAEREARRVFGDVDAVRRELYRIGNQNSRRLRWTEGMGLMLADVRIALRSLARRPVYGISATLTLAIGAGAAATVFSVLDGMLLRPLPYPEPERLVAIWERHVPRARERNVVSVPAFESFREQSTSYAAITGIVPHRTTTTGENPERVYGAEVSPEWFVVTGIAPRLGRGFTAADALAMPRPVVLSDALWRARYGADESLVGRTIAFGDETYLLAGVMSAEFEAPAFGWLEASQRYWVPFVPDDNNRQWGRFLLVLARLQPGVTVSTADAEAQRIAGGAGPHDARNEWSAHVTTLHDEVTGDVRTHALAVSVAVGLLLLITIGNVAGVVCVRARARAGELRVRTVLGASRGRIARQLIAEGAAIALLSLPLALLIVFAAVRGAVQLLPPELPRLDDVVVS